MPSFGFVGPTYIRGAQRERTINLYPEFVETNNPKSKIEFHATPGLQVHTTLPQSPVRALWAGDNRLFAVAGTGFYEVYSGGTYASRGTVATDSINSRAQILSNGTQLLIVSGGNAYCDNGGAANGANAVYQREGSYGTYIDGYFVVLKPNTNQFYLSGLRDGTSWNELDFGVKEGAPDRLIAVEGNAPHLWLFGRRTTEVWYHSGAADFPFERVPGGVIEEGAVNPHTIVDLDDSLFFLAEDNRGGPVVFRTRGMQLERVSNIFIETSLALWPQQSLSQLTAFGYIYGHHRFYVLTLPLAASGSGTWVYDCATQMWHEWLYRSASPAEWQPTLARCHAYTTPGYAGVGAGGVHYVGSRATGKIYSLMTGVATDDGAAIMRYRQAPHVTDENRALFHHRFELDALGPLDETNTTLRWSDDNGTSWTTPRAPRTPAAPTGRLRRLVWPRLGRSRDRIYALTISGGVASDLAIIDAYLTGAPGTGI